MLNEKDPQKRMKKFHGSKIFTSFLESSRLLLKLGNPSR
jgi:hypothetical protein